MFPLLSGMADVHLRADAAHTGSLSMTVLFTAVPPDSGCGVYGSFK